ncbi:MAG: HAD-IA family hydrolase [Rubrivivax sp.]
MNPKAIIFDVDGTLADTEEGHRQAYNCAFEEAGLPWRWDQALYARLLAVTGGKERMRYFVADFARGWAAPADLDDLIVRLYRRKTEIYTAMVRAGGMPLRPGIAELIVRAHAAGIRLAVATTTAQDNVAALLDANLGRSWPRLVGVLGCGDQVPHKKPAPDIYLWVLGQLGLDAAECLALEDSELGLAAARAAGLRTFVTVNAYTRAQDFRGAEAVFEDLADLDAFVRAAGLELPALE